MQLENIMVRTNTFALLTGYGRRRQLWRVVIRKENTYRGVFAAEAEVVKRRRKEAMWVLFRATQLGRTG